MCYELSESYFGGNSREMHNIIVHTEYNVLKGKYVSYSIYLSSFCSAFDNDNDNIKKCPVFRHKIKVWDIENM